MRTLFSFLLFFISNSLLAQTELYGISKTPGSNKIIYLSTINPATGFVNVFTGPLASNHLSVGDGSAFNFTDGLYYYIAPGSLLTESSVINGSSNNIAMNLSGCYLRSLQYACRDSSMYGFMHCPGSQSIGFGEVNLGSGSFGNSLIGISTFPGDDYTYDKINHRYIFTSNNLLYTINLNTMAVDSLILPIPSGSRFLFPQYNCHDSLIYGCYRNSGSIDNFLASYNLITGVFTVISTSPFVNGGVLGGGTALDISRGLYYYNLGSSMVSVNISDGTIAANKWYTFSISGPQNVFQIQIDQECYCEKLSTSGIAKGYELNLAVTNPIGDEIRISGIPDKAKLRLFDLTSRLLIERDFQFNLALEVPELSAGVYLYSIDIDGQLILGKLIKP